MPSRLPLQWFTSRFAGAPDVDCDGIRLRRPGSAASFRNVPFEQRCKPRNNLWMFVLHVPLLADVLAEIEKLHERELARIVAARAGRAPASGPGTERQLPVSFPDGERAIGRMMDDRAAQRRLALQQRGKKAHTVFS